MSLETPKVLTKTLNSTGTPLLDSQHLSLHTAMLCSMVILIWFHFFEQGKVHVIVFQCISGCSFDCVVALYYRNRNHLDIEEKKRTVVKISCLS